MLVLTRCIGESLVIHTDQGEVQITVTRCTNRRCRLGIDAPDSFRIVRSEIVQREQDAADNYDGPRCSHCHDPVTAINGLIVDYVGSKWLCDSCAAAAEDKADADRDVRDFDRWIQGR